LIETTESIHMNVTNKKSTWWKNKKTWCATCCRI